MVRKVLGGVPREVLPGVVQRQAEAPPDERPAPVPLSAPKKQANPISASFHRDLLTNLNDIQFAYGMMTVGVLLVPTDAIVVVSRTVAIENGVPIPFRT